MEVEHEGRRKVAQDKNKKKLRDQLLEMAHRQGVKPIDDVSVLQAPEPIEDEQFEEEITNQRLRHRMQVRAAK